MSLGDILTKRDVAEFLHVSERTVEQRMSEGSIPYVYKTGMTSKSLRLGAGKVASALRDDIPFALRQATVFLGVSTQMMSSAEVSEDKRL